MLAHEAPDNPTKYHSADILEQQEELSAWSTSFWKRAFDIFLVALTLPVLFPMLSLLAAAVLLLSGKPVFFLQLRIGRNERPFSIFKFRTMYNTEADMVSDMAATSHDRVTPVGRLLRRFKMDELPQVINVLRGEMSLVGPRPKIPEQQLKPFSCRPGITGAATLAFAREEVLFAQIPQGSLPNFYQTVVLPMKQQLDANYMQKSSLLSDLLILFRTIFGCLRPATSIAATNLVDISAFQLVDDACETQ